MNVTNLDGGMLGWNGASVSGLPEIHMPAPAPDATFAEIVAVTWSLEHSTEQWYIRLASRWGGHETAGELFQQLAQEEERHQATLTTAAANNGISQPDLSELCSSLGLGEGQPEARIEGGISLVEALRWADSAELFRLLELASAIEAIAFDRYASLARTSKPPAQSLFHRLASAEHHHYLKLSEALEPTLAHNPAG
jgi:rubrerythrin